MSKTQSTLRIREKANLDREIDAFLIDRRARALSPRTIDYYDEKLTLFRAYLQAQGLRASELIGLSVGDVDMHTGRSWCAMAKAADSAPCSWAARRVVR